MKTLTKSIVGAFAAMALLAAASASADRGYHRHYHHGGRVHFGLTLGAPLWYPGPYYYPYHYSYPAPVVVQPAPRVYVERDDEVAGLPSTYSTASSPYWHYCRDSNTYYPYVRECASPWERVPAAPAAR